MAFKLQKQPPRGVPRKRTAFPKKTSERLLLKSLDDS